MAVIAVVNGLDEETEYQIHVDLDAIELGRGPRLEPIFGPRVIFGPCILAVSDCIQALSWHDETPVYAAMAAI